MSHDSVPTHPVPPRLRDGAEVPYVGPNFEAYRKAHVETVGENADKWWAKVRGRCITVNPVLITSMLAIDGEGTVALGYSLPDG